VGLKAWHVIVAAVVLPLGFVLVAIYETPDDRFALVCTDDAGKSDPLCRCAANELRARHGYEDDPDELIGAMGRFEDRTSGPSDFVYEPKPEFLVSVKTCESREELATRGPQVAVAVTGTVRRWFAAAREGDARALCSELGTDRFVRSYDGGVHRRPCARLGDLPSTSRTPLDDTLDDVFPEERRARERERARARSDRRAVGKSMADRSLPRAEDVSIDTVEFDVDRGARIERNGEITYARKARVEASASGRRFTVAVVRNVSSTSWQIDRLSGVDRR